MHSTISGSHCQGQKEHSLAEGKGPGSSLLTPSPELSLQVSVLFFVCSLVLRGRDDHLFSLPCEVRGGPDQPWSEAGELWVSDGNALEVPAPSSPHFLHFAASMEFNLRIKDAGTGGGVHLCLNCHYLSQHFLGMGEVDCRWVIWRRQKSSGAFPSLPQSRIEMLLSSTLHSACLDSNVVCVCVCLCMFCTSAPGYIVCVYPCASL